MSIVKRFVPSRKEKPTLLDAGCGYGKFLALASKEFRVTGIDPSAYAISEVRKIVPEATLSVSTIEKFHPGSQLDVITAFDVLEHLEDPRDALDKIHGLLSENGIFVCVVPVYDGPLGTIGGWLDHDSTHLHKWHRSAWLRLFEEKFRLLFRAGIIRYTLPILGNYVHMSAPWFWRWGQAVLFVGRKR